MVVIWGLMVVVVLLVYVSFVRSDVVDCEWCLHHHCGGILCCILVWVDGFGVCETVGRGQLSLVVMSGFGLDHMGE